MRGANNLPLKYLREIAQFFHWRTKKKVWIIRFNTKISNWKSSDMKARMKSNNWLLKLKTWKLNMINQWMKWLKVRSISKEKKLSRIKRLLSKSKESKIITHRWSRQLTDMKSDLKVKKKMLQRFFKSEFREFKLKKKMSKRSMSKREKH